MGPKSMTGIDPSEPQLIYARQRDGLDGTQWIKGDAMDLPFPADSFDIAVMPLVIFSSPSLPKAWRKWFVW